MRSRKRKPTREEVDDQKFRNAMEGERFRARIEREANEALICPSCGSSDWKMKPRYLANYVANDLIATLTCRKCKRHILFSTKLEEDEPEPEQDEEELDDFTDQLYNQLEITGVDPFMEEILKTRLRRRISRMDANERLRLLMYLR